jgi:DNA-binding response OmpR family regulator
MYLGIRHIAHDSYEAAAHSAESRSIADPGESNLARRRVLIVDEDIEDLIRNTEPFEAHGFEVHKCTSCEAAMRSVEREDFDLALVSRGSPLFEGRRVIRHLVRYSSCTPFIVLAFPNDAKCYQQAMELGAVEYLEKPVSTAELDRVIQRYLGSPTCIL